LEKTFFLLKLGKSKKIVFFSLSFIKVSQKERIALAHFSFFRINKIAV